MNYSRTEYLYKNFITQLIIFLISLFLAFYSRKVFIDSLGVEFIGMLTVISSFIGYLNMAELGVGTALSAKLYKPFKEDNKEKILNLLYVLRKMYFFIGLIILLISIFLSFLIAEFFLGDYLNKNLIYLTFFIMLFSSLLGYFVNYKTILFIASQQEYFYMRILEGIRIITTILQIIVLIYYKDPYIFLSLLFISTIFNSLILNYWISKKFPWSRSKIEFKDKKLFNEIFKFVKRIFAHKIKDGFIIHSMPIFILNFGNLSLVTLYSNYVLLSDRLTMLAVRFHNSMTASIGNLVAENNIPLILSRFKQIYLIKFFLGTFLAFFFYLSSSTIISLWLGGDFVLTNDIVIILSIYIFLNQIKGSIDIFNHAYGNYNDLKAVFVELVLTVLLMLVGGYKYGLVGILIGNIIGIFGVGLTWRPYYLYSKGFNIKFLDYVIVFFKNILAVVIVITLMNVFILYNFDGKFDLIEESNNFFELFLNLLELVVVYILFSSLTYLCLFYEDIIFLIKKISFTARTK